MRELDRMAAEAAEDRLKLEQLIVQSERFILKCASRATHRFITKSDDEWSVALFAFAQAVQKYQFDKGSFLAFAQTTIGSRLIDYQRGQGKYSLEISVNPTVFSADEDEEDAFYTIRKAVRNQITQTPDDQIGLEIQAANQVFRKYGFTFFELADCSPRTQKTKAVCAKAAAYLLHNPLLLREMRASRQLPLKILEKNAKLPRKKLERHRKYIIAAVEMLSGEYPCLACYMQYIREEMDK